MAKGDGGVLSVTVTPAIRELLAAQREKRKPRLSVVTEKTPQHGPTAESLVDGSSNIPLCVIAARLLLGDRTMIPLAIAYLKFWLEKELAGMEAPSTSYFVLAHGTACLAIYKAAVSMKHADLEDLAVRTFAAIVNVLAALTRPGTTGPIAASGPRCVAEKMVGGEDVLEWLMRGRKFAGKSVDPNNSNFAPLRWLLNELQDLHAAPDFDGAKEWLLHGSAMGLTAELAKIQFGSGHMRIRHYRDSEGRWGVVSYWPRGLMSPSVGDAKKCARRLGAVVYGDGRHSVMPWSPIGFVAHSDLTVDSLSGETGLCAMYPQGHGFGESQQCQDWLDLPPGDLVVQFDIQRHPDSWPEGWKEPSNG